MSKKFSDFGKSYTEWNYLIDEWIFNERNRNITKRRFLDGVKIEALAEEFDMSVSQIKRILCKSANMLYKKITK